MIHLAAQHLTGNPLLDYVSQLGAVGVMAYLAWALISGKLVTRDAHLRVIAERDRAVDLVYQHAELTTRALDVAERKTP